VRALIALALVACVTVKQPPPQQQQATAQTIVVQWKVEQGDGDRVNVTLVVDGRAVAIGSLASATLDAVGPKTCALRAAHPLRTELVCGDANYYEAALETGGLVVTLVDGAQRNVVKRMAVQGDGLVVQALRLPP
jgi:hypothetical protein